MEEFETLQSIWSKQVISHKEVSAVDLIQRAEAHIKKLKAGQVGTVAILSVLIAVLIGYFISMGAYKFNGLTIGLGIMIGVIALRVFLEWMSMRKFKVIKPDSTLQEFTDKMQQYYQWRKKIHTVFIPIIYALYMFGFTLLLPSFKENMSVGLYLYVMISGYVFLTVFGLFMIRILRREMNLLRFLKDIK